MTCADRGATLDIYLDGELSGDTLRDLSEHLEQCDACPTELEARRALRQTLRGAFLRSPSLGPGEAFLASARATVRAEEERSRPSQWAGVGNWLGVAAAFLLVAGVAWLVDSLPRMPSLSVAMAAISDHAAGDHRNCALHFALDETPISLDDAARLYEPAYRGLREAVATSTPVADGQVQLVEAHACVFRGRRFAHIVLRRGGRIVSLLVTPTRQDGIAGKLTDVSACPTSGDLKVACTTAGGYAMFVVSDMPDADNLALARLLAPAVRAHLAGA
jgi:anti-sigma factor RsiW